MRQKHLCCVIVLMTICGQVSVAGVGEWKTFTSKRDVRDIVSNGNMIWAATTGGVFSYDLADTSFRQFTTSDGLKTIDLSAIALDSSGGVWIGAVNGFLQRYDPASQTWQYITDLALRTDPLKRIHRLEIAGDTLFILSDIGLSVFSVSKMEFQDTYSRFGTPPNQLVGGVTSAKMFNGRMWVGTRTGIASTPLTTANPAAPESWQIATTAQGLPANLISGLEVLCDTLYCSTSNGMAFYDGVAWRSIGTTLGTNILDLSLRQGGTECAGANPDSLLFVSANVLGSIAGGGAISSSSGFPASLTSVSSRSSIVLGTQGQGAILLDVSTRKMVLPPGPPSNKFVGLAVDNNSVLWSGTGVSNGDGFMSYDGQSWRSYTTAQESLLAYDNYYKVNIGFNNTKWVSGFGQGVALLDADGTVQRVLNTTNGLSPSIDPRFVVVGGVATDRDGVAWIVNRTPRGDTALVTYAPDGTLGYVKGLTTRTNPAIVFTDIVIDNNGTKWLANFNRFESVLPRALYFYNERGVSSRTGRNWDSLTTLDGLTSNKVYSLAVDRDGALWIGSDAGISVIYDPSTLRPHPYHPLREQIIQAIVSDPLNNKWIATRQGVFVLSPDGTVILDRYTVENTDGKLLDNDVASLAIDANTGLIYFGTEKGLSRLSTSAVAPKRSFGDLTFSPNPLNLPSSSLVTIDGLVQSSLIKILSVNGDLVREIRSPGGRVGFWDGKNARGSYVGSGIYLVIAYSEDGSKVATGKLAVVRR